MRPWAILVFALISCGSDEAAPPEGPARILHDFAPGSADSFPSFLTDVNGTLYH